MPAPIAVNIREQAVAAYEGAKETLASVASRFGMSVGSLSRYLRQHRQQGQPDDGKKPGCPPTYTTEELELLRQQTKERPQASTTELRQFMAQRTGKSVSRGTMDTYLRTLGIRRYRPVQATTVVAEVQTKTETRYQDRHRRHEPGTYPTDLTDHEWSLLKEHFRPNPVGRPPDHEPRVMLNAIFYVLRTGCAWWMLPHDFPPYKSVYTTFRRWISHGRLQKAHDVLRREYRRRLGRNEDPSAIIVDSQSVKTTEKGGPEDTMPARKSKAESDTSRSTPRVS